MFLYLLFIFGVGKDMLYAAVVKKNFCRNISTYNIIVNIKTAFTLHNFTIQTHFQEHIPSTMQRHATLLNKPSDKVCHDKYRDHHDSTHMLKRLVKQ